MLALALPLALASRPVAVLVLPLPLELARVPTAVLALLSPPALALFPAATLALPLPLEVALFPVEVLALPSPLALAEVPVAVLVLPAPLALAWFPVAVLLLRLPLALARFPIAVLPPATPWASAPLPQAKLKIERPAVAPPEPCGGAPVTLPPQMNCALAGVATMKLRTTSKANRNAWTEQDLFFVSFIKLFSLNLHDTVLVFVCICGLLNAASFWRSRSSWSYFGLGRVVVSLLASSILVKKTRTDSTQTSTVSSRVA